MPYINICGSYALPLPKKRFADFCLSRIFFLVIKYKIYLKKENEEKMKLMRFKRVQKESNV